MFVRLLLATNSHLLFSIYIFNIYLSLRYQPQVEVEGSSSSPRLIFEGALIKFGELCIDIVTLNISVI